MKSWNTVIRSHMIYSFVHKTIFLQILQLLEVLLEIRTFVQFWQFQLNILLTVVKYCLVNKREHQLRVVNCRRTLFQTLHTNASLTQPNNLLSVQPSIQYWVGINWWQWHLMVSLKVTSCDNEPYSKWRHKYKWRR